MCLLVLTVEHGKEHTHRQRHTETRTGWVRGWLMQCCDTHYPKCVSSYCVTSTASYDHGWGGIRGRLTQIRGFRRNVMILLGITSICGGWLAQIWLFLDYTSSQRTFIHSSLHEHFKNNSSLYVIASILFFLPPKEWHGPHGPVTRGQSRRESKSFHTQSLHNMERFLTPISSIAVWVWERNHRKETGEKEREGVSKKEKERATEWALRQYRESTWGSLYINMHKFLPPASFDCGNDAQYKKNVSAQWCVQSNTLAHFPLE